ncbi:MAG: DUF559 domain-containing protein [Deltaproteobacteria bacterium]|nr:DUF559 domain-containing protein [Deltaproteobacteria bacterium]
MERPAKRLSRKCQNCGEIFQSKLSDINRGGGKFCSRVCYNTRKTKSSCYIRVICKNCGKEFKTWKAWLKKGGGHFCSRYCMAENYKKGEFRKCIVCGKEFYFQRARENRKDAGKYCSLQCRDNGKSIVKNCLVCSKPFKALAIYEGTNLEKKYCSSQCYLLSRNKEKITIICKYCKKPFLILKSYLNHKPALYCSSQCSIESKKKRIDVKCNFCGKIFEKKECYSNGKNYCSQKCRCADMKNGFLKICEFCGTEFYIRPSEIKKGEERNFKAGRYCSQECYKKSCEPTGLEIEGRSILYEIGVAFSEQVKIGRYIVDAFIPQKKIIIEWDGLYWHSIPKRIESDNNKNNYLKAKGYNILRFDEIEVYNYRNAVMNRIREAIYNVL